METKTSIRHRIASQREALLAQLKETPIVEIACKKVGIGRATYYRWKKEDSPFAKATDEAQSEGNKLINDMAESQLLSAIRDKKLAALVPTIATAKNTEEKNA